MTTSIGVLRSNQTFDPSTSTFPYSGGLSTDAPSFVPGYVLQEKMTKIEKLTQELLAAQKNLGNLYSLQSKKIRKLETRLGNAGTKISEQKQQLDALQHFVQGMEFSMSNQFKQHAKLLQQIQDLPERVQVLEEHSNYQHRSLRNIVNKFQRRQPLASPSTIPPSSTVSSRRRDRNDPTTQPDSESDDGFVDLSPRDADNLVPKTRSSFSSALTTKYSTNVSHFTVLRRPGAALISGPTAFQPASKADVNPGGRAGLNASVRKRS